MTYCNFIGPTKRERGSFLGDSMINKTSKPLNLGITLLEETACHQTCMFASKALKTSKPFNQVSPKLTRIEARRISTETCWCSPVSVLHLFSNTIPPAPAPHCFSFHHSAISVSAAATAAVSAAGASAVDLTKGAGRVFRGV